MTQGLVNEHISFKLNLTEQTTELPSVAKANWVSSICGQTAFIRYYDCCLAEEKKAKYITYEDILGTNVEIQA